MHLWSMIVCAESYAKEEQFDDDRDKLEEDSPDYEGDIEGVSVICHQICWNLQQIKLLAANQALGSKWKE